MVSSLTLLGLWTFHYKLLTDCITKHCNDLYSLIFSFFLCLQTANRNCNVSANIEIVNLLWFFNILFPFVDC